MVNQFLKKSAVSALALLPVLAMANTTGNAGSGTVGGNGKNAFDEFEATVLSWATGPLGTGLAITMMLMGAATGVAKNSPMPALSGIAGAAFLNWGPGIIQSFTGGALI